MDPKTTILAAWSASNSKDWEACRTHMQTYLTWRQQGGFAPVIQKPNEFSKGWNGDFVYSELVGKLRSYGELRNLPKEVFELDLFTRSYIACALWSSYEETESGGQPLDYDYDETDLSIEALERIVRDCKQFQSDNEELLSDSGIEEGRAGHCFWLNRNGHGSGFWDEHTIAEEYREPLSEASHAFGECDLYVGDDGRLYI